MCLWCLCKCCCGPYKFTHVAAITTAVEAGLFMCLNIYLILLYTCAIPPSEDGSAQFAENIRSWFFYDEDNCEAKYDDYEEPDWIEPIPESFNDSNAADKVTAKKNESYQITYLVFHFLWLVSCFVLIYGNARKKWLYYLPWLFIALFLVVFDISIGCIYITLWAETELDWDEGSAIFWMIMLYFRGFAILGLNIMFMFNVSETCYKSYKKQKKKEKQTQQIKLEVETNVRNEINNRPSGSDAKDQPTQGTSTQIIVINNPVPTQPNDSPYGHPRDPVPTKPNDSPYGHPRRPAPPPPPPPIHKLEPPPPYQPSAPPENTYTPESMRPFSYTNPGYRPSSESEIHESGHKN